MGYKADQAYEEEEARAFRALPFWTRFRTNVVTAVIVAALAVTFVLAVTAQLWV